MIKRCHLTSIAVLLSTMAAGAASPDPQWIKLQTVPYTLNNKQDAIAFSDAQRGWYGNVTGRVYRTDDAG